MVDINTYALKIELEADKSAIEDIFSYLDSSVNDISEKLSQGIANVFDDVVSNSSYFSDSLDDVSVSVTRLNNDFLVFNDSLEYSLKSLGDASGGVEQVMSDISNNLNGFVKPISEFVDDIRVGADTLESISDRLEMSKSFSKTISDNMSLMVNDSIKFNESLLSSDGILENTSQNIENMRDYASEFNKSFDSSKDILNEITNGSVNTLAEHFENISESSHKLVDLQEQISNSDFLSRFSSKFSNVSVIIRGISSQLGVIMQTGANVIEGIAQNLGAVEASRARVIKGSVIAADNIKREFDGLRMIGDSIIDIEGLISSKNEEHLRELQYVADETVAVAKLKRNFEDVNNQVRDNSNAIERLKSNYEAIVNFFKSWEDGMERFITVENRAHGTMLDMQDTSALIASNYGLIGRQAVEVMEVLVDIKTPTQDLVRLGGAIGQTSRITGVSSKVLADFSRNLRFAEDSSMSFEESMYMVIEAQRKFGLTAEDTSKVLSGAVLSVGEQIAFFGEDSPAQFLAADLALRGFGKNAALTQKDMDALSEKLYLTGAEAERFYQAIGGSASMDPTQRAEHLQKTLISLGKELQDVNGDINALTVDQQQNLRAIASVLDLPVSAIGNVAKAEKELAATGGTLFTDVGQFAAQASMSADIAADYADTLGQVSVELRLLRQNIVQIIQPFITFAMRGLLPVISAIRQLIGFVATLVGWISYAINTLRELHPVFAYIIQQFELLAGLVLALGGSMVVLGGIVGMLTAVFGRFGGILTRIPQALTNFGNVLTSIVRGAGQLFVEFMTFLGQGLSVLGRQVQPVILPLLALGLAFLMTGGGAQMFANSVKIIADIGDDTIGALLGITAAIAILLGVLVLLSGPATAGAVGLLAMGAAVLLVGTGVFLATTGISMLLDAITRFSTDSEKFADGMYGIAEGLMVLSVAGFLAAPGLLVLGVASAVAFIPLMLAGTALEKFAGAMKTLSDVDVVKVSGDLYNASQHIVSGGVALFVGSGSLILGAVGLITAAPILTAGIAAMSIPIAMLMPLGILLTASIYWMKSSSQDFYDTAMRLKDGSIAILGSAKALSVANVMLTSAIIGLMAVAPNMSRAASDIQNSQQKLVKSFEGISEVDYSSLVSSISSSADSIKKISSELGEMAGVLGTTLDGVSESLDKTNEFNTIIRSIADSLTQLDIALNSNILDNSNNILSGLDNLVGSSDRFASIPDKYAATIDKLNSLDVNADAFLSKLEALSTSIELYVNNIGSSISKIDSIELSPTVTQQTEVIRNEINNQQEIKPPELTKDQTKMDQTNAEILEEMKIMNKNMAMLLNLLMESNNRPKSSVSRVTHSVNDSLLNKMNI